MGPLLAALVVIPFGRGAISWFALVALVGIFVLARIGGWYKRELHAAVRNHAGVTKTAPRFPRRTVRSTFHFGRFGLLQIFLYRFDDQLLHLLPDGQVLHVGAGGAILPFRISCSLGYRNIPSD